MTTRRVRGWRRVLALAVAPILGLAAMPARPENADSLEALRAEITRLKVEQAERDARLRQLEDRLNALESAPSAPAAVAVTSPVAESPSRLRVSGDFRLRYEGNYGDADADDWDRGVLRARLHADYTVTRWLTVGGRLATGDPDDPNSTDITLSNFADDLDFSLDQAYARVDVGKLRAWGGKFPLPFTRTDVVWDGDVNPQGVGGTYRLPLARGGAIHASGLYFLVDESVAGSDSSMAGAQVGYDAPLGEALRFGLSVAGYDYSLRGVAGADSGDFRSNLIGPDGRYVSDFNLVDVIAGIDWTGPADHWPVRLLTEYVHNTGARTSGDTAWNLELSAGRARAQGDWRIGYGFSMAEVDAVLAAFSHDNTTLATNYRQHTLYVNYVPLDNLTLDATYYRYRPYSAEFAGGSDPGDWLDRVRLNFLVAF